MASILRAASALAAVCGCAAAASVIASCIATDPPALPVLPPRRPLIIQTDPPVGVVLTRFPRPVVVTVELVDPKASLAYRAFVDYEPVMDFPAAVTFTDGAGRYVLCGIPDATEVSIGAAADGFFGYAQVPSGQTDRVDIYLRR